jgi:uncharacterized protein (DUF1800 family)
MSDLDSHGIVENDSSVESANTGPDRDTDQKLLRSAGLLAVAAVALSACGGDDSESSTPPPAGGNPDPEPTPQPPPGSPEPSPPALPTANEAARFLSQATFGATDEDIQSVRQEGYETWLNQQFALPLGRSHFDQLTDRGYKTEAASKFGQSSTLDGVIYTGFITGVDQLRKRVAFALSQLMVVGVSGVEANYRIFGVASYFDTLEAHAFGNFRDLMEAVSLHPAMSVYLTYRGNRKADPNTGRLPDENYARELLQLFTIGLYELRADGRPKQPLKETYSQRDISELAKVFTGWNFDGFVDAASTELDYWRNPLMSVTNQVSTQSKSFLGLTVPENTGAYESLQMALDHIFAHPNVGPFISKQLIQRLVTSNPSDNYVNRVASVFNDNGLSVRGDLKAVVKAILLDPEARDTGKLLDPTWGKLREPVLRLTSWARAFRAQSANGKWEFGELDDPASHLGQAPFRSVSVFNFYRPGYVPPNTTIADQQLGAPEFQITTETSTVGYINYLQMFVNGLFMNSEPPAYIRSVYEREVNLSVDDLIDRLDLLLLAGAMASSTRSRIRTALASLPDTNDQQKLVRVKACALLIMASPEFIVQK